MKPGTASSSSVPGLHPREGDALMLEDVQNDFLPGGRLAVSGADEIIPALNRYLDLFQRNALPVYASRDWHPADHCSFREQGGLWPPHCIAGSPGAAFPSELSLPAAATLISKAVQRNAEAYSSFEGTDLERQLRAAGITRLFVGGLATDYCVLNTVRDALKRGFCVLLLLDGIRAVNLNPDDGQDAIEEMAALGACPVRFDEIAA